MGEVLRPGSPPLRDGRLSLSQALGESGGLSPVSANASQLYAAQPEWPKSANLSPLMPATRWSMHWPRGFELRPRDVVVVDPAPLVRWNRVINLLLPSAQGLNTMRAVSGNFKHRALCES